MRFGQGLQQVLVTGDSESPRVFFSIAQAYTGCVAVVSGTNCFIIISTIKLANPGHIYTIYTQVYMWNIHRHPSCFFLFY